MSTPESSDKDKAVSLDDLLGIAPEDRIEPIRGKPSEQTKRPLTAPPQLNAVITVDPSRPAEVPEEILLDDALRNIGRSTDVRPISRFSYHTSVGTLKAPYRCSVCHVAPLGTAEVELVGLGISDKKIGHIYLCKNCLLEAGGHVGYIGKSSLEYRALLQHYENTKSLIEENKRLQDELRDLNSLINRLNTIAVGGQVDMVEGIEQT